MILENESRRDQPHRHKPQRSVAIIDAPIHRTRNARPVTGPRIQRIQLELNPGEPITGTIRDQSGQAQSFRGWLELTTKLERLRNGDDAASDPAPSRHRSA
jgi:hypothetical protein